jgi:hypothetical protein
MNNLHPYRNTAKPPQIAFFAASPQHRSGLIGKGREVAVV